VCRVYASRAENKRSEFDSTWNVKLQLKAKDEKQRKNFRNSLHHQKSERKRQKHKTDRKLEGFRLQSDCILVRCCSLTLCKYFFISLSHTISQRHPKATPTTHNVDGNRECSSFKLRAREQCGEEKQTIKVTVSESTKKRVFYEVPVSENTWKRMRNKNMMSGREHDEKNAPKKKGENERKM